MRVDYINKQTKRLGILNKVEINYLEENNKTNPYFVFNLSKDQESRLIRRRELGIF